MIDLRCGKRVSRLVLYRFVALALHEPGPLLAEMLESEPARAGAIQAAEDILGPDGGMEVRAMFKAFSAAGEQEAAFNQVQAEYKRLFNWPAAPQSPPRSWLCDMPCPAEQKGLAPGLPVRLKQKLLREAEFDSRLDSAPRMGDAARILECLYHLLSIGGDSDQGPTQDRRGEGVRRHCVPRLSRFAACMVKESGNAFYNHFGRLLDQFVLCEAL